MGHEGFTVEEATSTEAGRIRSVILDTIAGRVGQVADVHPRLLEGIETAARKLASLGPGPREGALPQPSERPWCRDCGPGYRLGDEGCRHDRDHEAAEGDTGVCRTCALPIWWETGEIGHRERVGWSDRIKRGGDSLVCFKAIGYRHVPMGAREEAIYNAGVKAGKAGA